MDKIKPEIKVQVEWLHRMDRIDASNEDYAVLNGLGNMDHFKTVLNDRPFEGLTVRLFNPATKLVESLLG